MIPNASPTPLIPLPIVSCYILPRIAPLSSTPLLYLPLTFPFPTEQLDKTKITGIGPVDQIQGDVNNLLGNQLGSKGLAAPITDATSKEGINRAERGGKGDDGGYVPKMGGAEKPLDALAGGAQSAGGAVADGAKSAGGWLPGWGGSGKKEEPKK